MNRPQYQMWIIVLLLVLGTAVACRNQTEERLVYVAPTTVNCPDTTTPSCYLVTYDPANGWATRALPIEGFIYNSGFYYVVRVSVPDGAEAVSTDAMQLVAVESQDLAVIKTVLIGPEQISCRGEGQPTCLQYQEAGNPEWLLYDTEVEGFSYQPGYYYQLTVSERYPTNAAAGDAASPAVARIWTFMQQLSRDTLAPASASAPTNPSATAVPSGDTGTTPLTGTDSTWTPITISDLGIQTTVPAGWTAVLSAGSGPVHAWGDAQGNFVNFTLSAEPNARAVIERMVLPANSATLADPTREQLTDVTIGPVAWTVYTRPTANQTVTLAATSAHGNVYLVSLFIDPANRDAVLGALLQNFVVTAP